MWMGGAGFWGQLGWWRVEGGRRLALSLEGTWRSQGVTVLGVIWYLYVTTPSVLRSGSGGVASTVSGLGSYLGQGDWGWGKGWHGSIHSARVGGSTVRECLTELSACSSGEEPGCHCCNCLHLIRALFPLTQPSPLVVA